MPAARSPAQIEASRRNGARSEGPVTEEGKARVARNALKHGLTAIHHLVLEDEVPDALEALIATVTEETEVWTVDGVPLLDLWGRPRQSPLAAPRALAERKADNRRLAAGPD